MCVRLHDTFIKFLHDNRTQTYIYFALLWLMLCLKWKWRKIYMDYVIFLLCFEGVLRSLEDLRAFSFVTGNWKKKFCINFPSASLLRSPLSLMLYSCWKKMSMMMPENLWKFMSEQFFKRHTRTELYAPLGSSRICHRLMTIPYMVRGPNNCQWH